eukprot:7356014-Prymnesium_polylepis.1
MSEGGDVPAAALAQRGVLPPQVSTPSTTHSTAYAHAHTPAAPMHGIRAMSCRVRVRFRSRYKFPGGNRNSTLEMLRKR